PLLEVSRAETERFLAERGIAARQDSSNADPRFARNRARMVVSAMSAEELDSVASLAAEMREVRALLDRFVAATDDVAATADATRSRSLPAAPWLRRGLLRRHIARLDPDARGVDVVRLAAQLDSGKRVSVTKNLELENRVLGRVREPVPHFEVELTPDKP